MAALWDDSELLQQCAPALSRECGSCGETPAHSSPRHAAGCPALTLRIKRTRWRRWSRSSRSYGTVTASCATCGTAWSASRTCVGTLATCLRCALGALHLLGSAPHARFSPRLSPRNPLFWPTITIPPPTP
eukprot:scaffold27508_cov36-Phaeocystis_antarctica.AAC.1